MAIPLSLVARLKNSHARLSKKSADTMWCSTAARSCLYCIPPEFFAATPAERATRARRTRHPKRNSTPAASADDKIQVVVHAAEGKQVGLVVGRILDIVDTTITSRSQATRPFGVLFSAIVQERVTEFLDLETIIRNAGKE